MGTSPWTGAVGLGFDVGSVVGAKNENEVLVEAVVEEIEEVVQDELVIFMDVGPEVVEVELEDVVDCKRVRELPDPSSFCEDG